MSTPHPIPFDTLRFVKRMTGAGMPLAQAEALAEEQRVLMDAHFATRRDADDLKLGLAEVKRDIEELKLGLAEVKRDIEELKLGLAEVKRDIEELKLGLAEVKRDIEELKLGLAVQKAELTMVKWIVSGVGFGMLLLLVRTFWPA